MTRHFREIFAFRSLVWALIKRHLATRYRGSALGFLWTFFNPLLLMLVYTLVFHYYIRSSTQPNYSIFLFCGLLPWMWVTSGVVEGTTSIVSSGHLITKSMFPPQILPTVSVCAAGINFILSLPLLFLFMWYAGMPFYWTLLLIPGIALLQLFLLLGVVYGLGALNVRYRDVQHLVGNFLTLLFFLCPILYEQSVVPERFRFTLEWNPFALLAIMYHKVILEGQIPELKLIGTVAGFVALSLIVGTAVFQRFREEFAELL